MDSIYKCQLRSHFLHEKLLIMQEKKEPTFETLWTADNEISTVKAEWKHSSISMRWCCKICRFSSPNQHALITHYKLKHCHQLIRSKHYEDIPEITSILESLDKDTTNQRMRTTALLGLPCCMRETTSNFTKICEVS